MRHGTLQTKIESCHDVCDYIIVLRVINTRAVLPVLMPWPANCVENLIVGMCQIFACFANFPTDIRNNLKPNQPKPGIFKST